MKNIIILLLLCSALFSKEYIDVVHLKNGSIIKGIIIEQIPNKTIKIETSGGSIFVYQMDEVIKIVKEEKYVPISTFSNHNPFKDKKLTSINPLGLVIGGISSLNFDKHISKNQVLSKKIDLWTVTKEYSSSYGEERSFTALGAGFGMGTRYYIPSTKSFSGLFAGASFDCMYTKVSIDYFNDVDYWNDPLDDYDYNSFALAAITTVGLSLPLGRIRVEPMLNLAYVFITDDYETTSGILLVPELRFGVVRF